MPCRGSTEADVEYDEILDQYHEILIKFDSSYDIIIGGDWNASLHRDKSCPRDRSLTSFLMEHNLVLPKSCPIGDTLFHVTGDSFSQIDYFFLSQYSELNEVASIEDMHYLNLSDHTHITLKSHIHLERLTQTNPKDETPQMLKPRIRWNKCDLNEYHSYVENSLNKDPPSDLTSNMDVDLAF